MWAILVIVAGYAVFVSMTARFTSLLLSGAFQEAVQQRRRRHMCEDLHDHLIVVGYGRVGRATARSTLASGRPCAVVDHRPELAEEVEALGAVWVEGDGRDLETLERAGVARASALVTALDDPDNLVVVVTARTLRPELRVVSRVNDTHWCERLQRAGAASLVPVFDSAGASLAATAASPSVVGVQELPAIGVRTEEIVVPEGSPLIGTAPADAMGLHPDLVIVGVRRDDELSRWHEIDAVIESGDVLVALGPPAAIAALTASVSGR
jgi:voltage-gated potassium channel